MAHSITKPIERTDGAAKASGGAKYIADYQLQGTLAARFVRSTVTRAQISAIHVPTLPAGYHWIDHRDVPGENAIALINRDWPAFAEGEIRYKGQIIAIMCGPNARELDRLVELVEIEYEEREAPITLDEGLACKGGALHGSDNIYGDFHLGEGAEIEEAFDDAARIVEGEYSTGFQEQLYLEPQGLTAWHERGTVVVKGSLQCPYYVKHAMETVLGDAAHSRAIATTVGGGFGGKEDYPEIMGAPLAVAALKVGKPLRMIFDRAEDLAWTSKRHPSRTRIRSAHDHNGQLLALDFDIVLDGGAYESYTQIVLMRAIFHSNGAYTFPHARVRGRGVATSTVPSGAFRGFGAPQAIFAIEMHMNRCARTFGIEPLEYRRRHFAKKGDTTITGGTLRDDVVLDEMIAKLEELSDYRKRRNRVSARPWRGLGISVFSHGCGFTGDGEQRIIKGRATVRKRADDVVEIMVASVDMGQGPQTTFRKVVGHVLGIDPREIEMVEADTEIVPDSGPTVASRTMMIVGFLLQEAARELKKAWRAGEAQSVTRHYEMPPGLAWDQDTLSGDAYAAFGWGINLCEVEVDPVTWETRVADAWGVYDVGVPIDERVVHGQIQGGMSQALGYGALEKLEVNREGVFEQRTMADYMVPTSLDFPRTGAATVENPYSYGPFGAKGMGEIVHDGGHAAFAGAVEDAVGRGCPRIPLVPETLSEIMEATE